MLSNAINFILTHSHELSNKIIEQLYLVGISVGIAIIVGVPVGIVATHYKRLRSLLLGTASILQTIPSLALLAFLIPFFGIGAKPAIIALFLYALLPIIRNTVTGLTNISQDNIEAAQALGFTPLQQLWMIELPLALPVIIAGIRTATAISMGIATLAAFIGAGGLGDFINRGLALNNVQYLLLGAVPAGLLALLLDFLIGQLEHSLQKTKSFAAKKSYFAFILLLILIVAVPCLGLYNNLQNTSSRNSVRIATKNFTEQLILGEMMAQLIEQNTHLKVIRDFNLGTTDIVQQAMLANQIDIYPEYTGTAYLTVLHQAYTGIAAQPLYSFVKDAYLKQFKIVWLSPFGFNNTQALAVREHFAQQNHVYTLSALFPFAHKLTIAGPTEFVQRPDGLPGLSRVYHLQFAHVRELAANLAFTAIDNDNVNVILAFSTDGRILAYHLVLLQDDKHLFPPYDCAPLIRLATLQAHPELVKALQPLAGLLNDQTMQQLNYQVDVKKRLPADVVREFLISQHLLKT